MRAAADEAHAHGAKVPVDYILRGAADGGTGPVADTLQRMRDRAITLTTTMVLMERGAS